jgi:CRP-like cAMP-binding protein
MNIKKIAPLLLTPDAFVTLTMEDALTVAEYMTLLHFEEAQIIFHANHQDDASDYMLLVVDGDVLIETSSSGNASVVVNILGSGHLIGEMGVLDGEPRSATCTAQTVVEVAMLTRSSVERLIVEHPKIASRFLMAIAKRLADRVRLGNQKLLMLNQVNLAMQQEIESKAPKRRHRFVTTISV